MLYGRLNSQPFSHPANESVKFYATMYQWNNSVVVHWGCNRVSLTSVVRRVQRINPSKRNWGGGRLLVPSCDKPIEPFERKC